MASGATRHPFGARAGGLIFSCLVLARTNPAVLLKAPLGLLPDAWQPPPPPPPPQQQQQQRAQPACVAVTARCRRRSTRRCVL
eukprot:5631250-Prymnesium_polylepis.1